MECPYQKTMCAQDATHKHVVRCIFDASSTLVNTLAWWAGWVVVVRVCVSRVHALLGLLLQ